METSVNTTTIEKAQMPKKKKGLANLNKKTKIFYYCILAWPIIQFLVFYIGVNFNSFLLMFEKIDRTTNQISFTLDNFANAWQRLTYGNGLALMAKYSLIAYVSGLLISVTLGLLFAYYIAKKMKFAGFFRVVLFIPHILPSIVLVIMYSQFVENALEYVLINYFGKTSKDALLSSPNTRYWTVLFYNLWISFGTAVLMYSNGMSAISPDIVEAAELDGATGIKEFFYISLPLIFSTIAVFLYTGVGGIFLNQMNLYSFFSYLAPEQTFGYFLYMQARGAGDNLAQYPIIATYGVYFTIVAVPLTLLVKYLLEKFGPSED